jgi:hypothetical protein
MSMIIGVHNGGALSGANSVRLLLTSPTDKTRYSIVVDEF